MPVVTTTQPTEDENNAATAQTSDQAAQQAATNATVPYEQEGQLTPIIKPKVQVQNTAQGNDAVMQAAQQGALDAQGAPNPTMGLVQSSVQNLLKNPLGYDSAKYQQNQLEQYDRNRASSMLAYQQANADTMNTGVNKEKAYNFAMEGAQGRSDLENQVAMEQANAERDAMLKAITSGQDVSKTQSGLDETAFNRLLNTRAQYEGERSQTQGFEDNVALTNLGFDHDTQLAAQEHGYDLEKLNTTYGFEATKAAIAHGYDLDTMSKQYGNDMAKLMATQDFEGAQNQLNRDTEVAMQSTDINQRNAALQKQLDYDKWAQENGQTFTAEQNAMNRTLEVSLKNLDLQGQTDLMNLKAAIDSKSALNANSFTASEAALDRAAAVAAQNGDIQGQKDILAQKAEIDKQAQAAQNKFTADLTASTQAWQTGENISKIDADKYMQTIDLAAKDAMQTKDIVAQQALETQKGNLQLQLQTQDMNEQEKMAYINSEIANAKATGDMTRQMQLIGFQTTQDITKMVEAGQIDEAKSYIQQQYQLALQNNDAANIQALELTKQQFQAKEDDENRALEQQKIDLQAAGVDMDKMNQTYTYLQGEVDAGRADPSVLTAFVQGVASKAGVTLTKPDPLAAQKAAQQKYNDMLGQFALTHPDVCTYTVPAGNSLGIIAGAVIDPNDTSTTYGSKNGTQMTAAEVVKALAGQLTVNSVSDSGAKAFNDFFNSATYGELTPEEKAAKANAGYLTADDLPSATAGDKFNIETATTVQDQRNGNTTSVPPGKYTVVEQTESTGDKFWGTKKNYVYEVLVDENGNSIATLKKTSSAEGNIISNLWAGDV